MEAEASLEAPSGKCKKHGRGCVFNTLGHVGESLGGDFFQRGSPDLFWKDPGEHFGRFLKILVTFGGRLWLYFRLKCGLDPICSEDGSGEAKKGAQPHRTQPLLEVIFKHFGV